jgi:hypothetical protein
MNFGHHRVFQKRTQIALITLMSQMGSCRLTEFICVICGISAICVCFWNSRDAWPSTGTIAIPRLAFGSLGMTAASIPRIQQSAPGSGSREGRR